MNSRHILYLICLATSLPSAARADDGASLGDRLVQVSRLIMQRHVDPPTQQELVLNALRVLHRAGGSERAPQLSEKVSAPAGDQPLARFLNEQAEAHGDGVSQLEERMLQGMAAAATGSHLAPIGEVRVRKLLNANQYVGTGIALGIVTRTKAPLITKVFYGGPAFRAGAKDGDQILAVDGADTRELPLGKVTELLRGDAGSKVEVVVKQADGEPRTLDITRNVAFIPTVAGYQQPAAGKWDYTVESAPHLAYVRVNRIGSSTPIELRDVERRLRGKPVRGLLIDLRFGGGALHDTVLVADSLIDGGKIGSVRSPSSEQHYAAKPGSLFAGLAVGVLIDRHTQSDREFLAAALKDCRQAMLIGEPTAGAGIVKSVIELPGGELALVLPTGVMHRGDGKPLRRPRRLAGLTPTDAIELAKRPAPLAPDEVVLLKDDERARLQAAYAFTRPGLRKPVEDPVLEKAIAALTKKLRTDGDLDDGSANDGGENGR